MNLFAPVSKIMTTNLITVSPEDHLEVLKTVFDKYRIHHIPVVQVREIVGLVSKIDFAKYLADVTFSTDSMENKQKTLQAARVQDVMTRRLGKLESTDRINVALEVFNKNLFHALPIVDNGELVGIVTTYDILRYLSEEKPEHPEDVYDDLK